MRSLAGNWHPGVGDWSFGEPWLPENHGSFPEQEMWGLAEDRGEPMIQKNHRPATVKTGSGRQ